MPALPYHQNLKSLLEYNTLDKRLNNNKKDIEQFNRNKQRPASSSNFKYQNRLLNELPLIFQGITFSESEFSAHIPISNIWYKHPRA